MIKATVIADAIALLQEFQDRLAAASPGKFEIDLHRRVMYTKIDLRVALNMLKVEIKDDE